MGRGGNDKTNKQAKHRKVLNRCLVFLSWGGFVWVNILILSLPSGGGEWSVKSQGVNITDIMSY